MNKAMKIIKILLTWIFALLLKSDRKNFKFKNEVCANYNYLWLERMQLLVFSILFLPVGIWLLITFLLNSNETIILQFAICVGYAVYLAFNRFRKSNATFKLAKAEYKKYKAEVKK